MDDPRIKTMDKEWVALILEAKKMGLTKAEVQIYLRTTSSQKLETVTK